MIGLMIFLIYLTQLIVIFKIPHSLDDVCLAGAIRELCESRDSGIVQLLIAAKYVT